MLALTIRAMGRDFLLAVDVKVCVCVMWQEGKRERGWLAVPIRRFSASCVDRQISQFCFAKREAKWRPGKKLNYGQV